MFHLSERVGRLSASYDEPRWETRSWTNVESRSLEQLEAALAVLRKFEQEVRNRQSANALTDATATAALLTISRDTLTEQALKATEEAVL